MGISKAIKKVAVVAGFGALGFLGADPAEAKVATDSFVISVTVNSVCTVAIGDIALPAYNFTTGSTATQPLTVNCTAGTPYEVVFDGGQNDATQSGTPSRAMNTADLDVNGDPILDEVAYVLSLEPNGGPAGTTPAAANLSDFAGSASINETGDGDDDVYGITATVAANDPAENADYSDTVQVSVNY